MTLEEIHQALNDKAQAQRSGIEARQTVKRANTEAMRIIKHIGKTVYPKRSGRFIVTRSK